MAGTPASSRSGDASVSWASYAVTLTAPTANPNLGAAGTIVGRYALAGTLCDFYVTISFSGAGVSGGTGNWRVSLPFPATAAMLAGQHVIGYLCCRDNSANVERSGGALLASDASYVELLADPTLGFVNASTPFAVATLDSYFLAGSYEAVT